MNGIMIIDKPKNVTSRDVVNMVSKKLHTKKVGHTGTLDPIATGVMIVCINSATKLVSELTCETKEYIATCTLGIETDTLDNTGTILNNHNVDIKENEIINVLNSFEGTYDQEVPKYSAVKINGKKLYEYARSNIDVSLPKRSVTIFKISLLDHPLNVDGKITFKFKCLVSKGTYIRSLIRDIAKKLNTYGIMTDLRRTKQGDFNIDQAISVDDINFDKVIPITEFLNCPQIEVTDDIKKQVLNGALVVNKYESDSVLFVDHGNAVALYKKKDLQYLKIDKMFYKGGCK